MHYVLTKIFAKVSRKQELQLGNILTSKNIVDFLDKLNYTEGNPIYNLIYIIAIKILNLFVFANLFSVFNS